MREMFKLNGAEADWQPIEYLRLPAACSVFSWRLKTSRELRDRRFVVEEFVCLNDREVIRLDSRIIEAGYRIKKRHRLFADVFPDSLTGTPDRPGAALIRI